MRPRPLLVMTLCLLTAVAARGADASAPTVREKLHAKIMESLPPPPPPKPKPPGEEQESAIPPLRMQPVVVSDSKLVRAVTAEMERHEQDRRDARFTPLEGGKLVNLGRLQLGSWWSPGGGWVFLSTQPPRTPRQAEAADARMKDLVELQRLHSTRSEPGR